MALSPQGIALENLICEEAETVNEDRTVSSPLGSSALPPADGGKAAWIFLAACFVVEGLVWGFAFAFGVFQEYYSTHAPFSSESSNIVTIGTTATGVMYMIPIVLFPTYKKWPHLPKISVWAGLPIMAIALIAGSFASKVSHLIATQGVLYAIGGSLVYCPVLIYLDEWFIQRKGLAFGVMWAGSGISGIIIPFITNTLLDKYGFRTTLRIWAVAYVVISGPLLYFLRPRVPVSSISQHPPVGLGFLRTSAFWFLQTGLLMESLGFFMPNLYLPTFAKSLGLSSSNGTLLVALVNGSAVVGTVIMGMLIDRFHVTTVILLSTVGATISVFVFWGTSSALPLLCIFSILYGLFAGGFVSTNAGIIKLLKQKDESIDVGSLLGLLSAARGVGVLVSGPLSEALVRRSPWQGKADLAYGSGYGALIAFTGITAAVGGVSFLGKILGQM